MDRPNASKKVVIVLDKVDAGVVLNVLIPVMRHPSSQAARSALLSLACQIKHATRGEPD